MLWFKALHLMTMVTWFSGLFYLPRLFVYHAMSQDEISQARFCVMERKLYYAITTPSMLLTLLFGAGLLHYNWSGYLQSTWMQIKLVLILLLVIYHHVCGYYLKQFAKNQNTHSHVFYRILNELPMLILVGVILLAVFKPSF